MISSTSVSTLPVVHTLWIGEDLGPLERLCIRSWLRHGHKVFVHSYKQLPSLPLGANSIDASTLCPAKEIFRNRHGSLAPFSDVYRMLLLQKYSELWLDADIFLLRPFTISDRNVIVREGTGDDARFNNSVMRLSGNHPILLEIQDRWRRPWKAIPWRNPRKAWTVISLSLGSLEPHARHLPWGALGADAMEKAVHENGFEGAILGYERSLTSHRVNLFAPVSDSDRYLQDPVLYVHLYGSQVRVDLNHPAPGSVYARLWSFDANSC